MKHDRIEIVHDLRGLSALVVVFYHCKFQLTEKDSLKGITDWLFAGGAAGVDIFFVISGFIMVYCTSDHTFKDKIITPLSFLQRRLIRICPPYVIISTLYLFITFNYQFISDFSLLKYFIKSILFLPIELKEAPHYGYPLLPVGWSLSYEMYFYLIFSLSILFGRYQYAFLLIYFSCTLFLLPYSLNHESLLDPHQLRDSMPLYLNFIINPIIWEFVVGILIGILYSNKTLFTFIKTNTPAWIPYSILLFVLWSHFSGYIWWHGLKGWGLNASLLVFIAVFYFSAYRSNYFLNKLGNYSYSLYLVHIPVQAFIFRLFTKFELKQYLQGQAALLLTVGASIIVSHISYYLIEKKLAHSLLGWLTTPTRKEAGTLATVPGVPRKGIQPQLQEYTTTDSDVYQPNH